MSKDNPYGGYVPVTEKPQPHVSGPPLTIVTDNPEKTEGSPINPMAHTGGEFSYLDTGIMLTIVGSAVCLMAWAKKRWDNRRLSPVRVAGD